MSPFLDHQGMGVKRVKDRTPLFWDETTSTVGNSDPPLVGDP